jgi:hypothetical protein
VAAKGPNETRSYDLQLAPCQKLAEPLFLERLESLKRSNAHLASRLIAPADLRFADEFRLKSGPWDLRCPSLGSHQSRKNAFQLRHGSSTVRRL